MAHKIMMTLKCLIKLSTEINLGGRNGLWDVFTLHMHIHALPLKKKNHSGSLGTEALNSFTCPRCPMGCTWQSACLGDTTFHLRVSPSLNASVSTFPKAWSLQNAWNALPLYRRTRTSQLKYDSLLLFKENFKESFLVLILLQYLSEL